jgi:hypothetical protein
MPYADQHIMLLVLFCNSGLVVIANLNSGGVPINPEKTDSPLFVDADAPLVMSITGKPLQPISWRDTQVVKLPCVVQHSQFAASNRLNLVWQTTREFTPPDLIGFIVMKVCDHDQ